MKITEMDDVELLVFEYMCRRLGLESRLGSTKEIREHIQTQRKQLDEILKQNKNNLADIEKMISALEKRKYKRD